jgi:hypothetical protein
MANMRILACICLLLALALPTGACKSRGVIVTVVNDSSDALQNVGIKYRRDGNDVIEALGAIRNQETRRVRIPCDDETHLNLVFQDTHGRQHDELIDVYIYGGRSPLTVHVTANYTIRCEGCDRR